MQQFEAAPEVRTELSLQDYASIFFRHRYALISIFAFVLAAGLAWTVISPEQFQSTSSVALRTNTNQLLFPPVSAGQRGQFLRQPLAELEYVQSTAFVNEANDVSPSGVSVRPDFDEDNQRSSQLRFTATGASPAAAQAAANSWAELYLSTRAEAEQGEIEQTLVTLEASIVELEREKAELLLPIKPIDDALLAETDSDAISRLTTQRLSLRQSLEDELLPISLQLRTMSQDLANLRISAGFVDRPDNSARLSIEAGPGVKVAPNLTRNLALAGLLGAALAAVSVLMLENFRKVIYTAKDIESIAPNVPILSRLPEFPKGVSSPMELAAATGSPYAQALERIVTSLLYRRAQTGEKRLSVLFTSSLQSEGKTTVASHLAYRLRSSPTETILVDADLRRPDVHNAFGLRQSGAGLGELLRQRVPLARHLLSIKDSPHVRLLFAGRPTDDAATLLRESFGPALDELPNDFDLLLIDAPPVLAVTDAEVMAQSVDVVVVVVRTGKTTQGQLADTLRKLADAGAAVAGFVFVGITNSAGSDYSDYYSYEANTAKGPVTDIGIEVVAAQPRPAARVTSAADGSGDRGSGESTRSRRQAGRPKPVGQPADASSNRAAARAARSATATRQRPETASITKIEPAKDASANATSSKELTSKKTGTKSSAAPDSSAQDKASSSGPKDESSSSKSALQRQDAEQLNADWLDDITVKDANPTKDKPL